MKNQKYKHKKSIENKKENGQQKLSVRVYFCVFLNMALYFEYRINKTALLQIAILLTGRAFGR